MWGHPHCSSPSSIQLSARQHNNALSVTSVSVHSPKPSAASHHGNSTRVFILLATPTKSANRPMAGQVKQQQVCIKKSMFPAWDHSMPISRMYINKDQSAATSRGTRQLGTSRRASQPQHIKNVHPSPILQDVICRRQPKGLGLSVTIQ